MNYRKQGLKALGLSFVAALGLMAFTAAGAQASGSFLIAGLGAFTNVPITGVAENTLTSRLLILKLNLEIFCHAGKVTNGSISSNGHGSATIVFEGCLAQGVSGTTGLLTGSACTMERNIEAKVLALVVLHNTKPYILFSPAEGEAFALVLEHTCPLPEHALIKGSVVASIANPDIDEVKKLISTKGMLTLFTADKLFYGANEAHLEADAIVELTGSPHGGLAFGAI
jgi:hypothetical protein